MIIDAGKLSALDMIKVSQFMENYHSLKIAILNQLLIGENAM